LEKGHDRIEKRKYYLSTDIDCLEQQYEWRGMIAISMVESVIQRGGKITTERRHFITTLNDVKAFAKAVRAHWGIENSLYWCLDVTFNEDRCHSRAGNTAEKISPSFVRSSSISSKIIPKNPPLLTPNASLPVQF